MTDFCICLALSTETFCYLNNHEQQFHVFDLVDQLRSSDSPPLLLDDNLVFLPFISLFLLFRYFINRQTWINLIEIIHGIALAAQSSSVVLQIFLLMSAGRPEKICETPWRSKYWKDLGVHVLGLWFLNTLCRGSVTSP